MASTNFKRIIACFGNIFEHYDTALYSFLSPFFATIFFSNQDYLSALIVTFAFLPLGKLARPIGSLFFGYIGDVKSRGQALFISLLGMALSTAMIGLLPTYQQAGVISPILLLGTRILQNFFAAGENVGGAIYLLENFTTEKGKDLASSIYASSTIAGILLASCGVTVFYHFNLVETSWRLLYFTGAVTALFGCLLRFGMVTTQSDVSVPNTGQHHFFKRLKHLWALKKVALTIATAAGFSYATYALAFVIMNGFIPMIADVTAEEVMKWNTGLLVLDFLLLPLFGLCAVRYSREKMMIFAATSAAVTGIPLAFLLSSNVVVFMLFVRMVIVVIGIWFSATFHSWSQSLVPKNYRYSLISFSYVLGAQLLGGTAPVISLWLYQQTQMPSSIMWYWAFLGMLTAITLSRTSKTVVPAKILNCSTTNFPLTR